MAEVSYIIKQENTSLSQVALENSKLERDWSCTNCERPRDNLVQAFNRLDSSCGNPTQFPVNGVSGPFTEDAHSSHTVCPAKCYIRGAGSHVAVVGETATATLHVVDQEGMEYHGPVQVSCDLVSSDGSSQGRGEVKKKGENEYEISYCPQRRGGHQLYIQVEGKDISRSPFTVAVISTTPTSIIKDLKGPSGVVVNKRGEIVVVESTGHCLSIFNVNGKKVRSFGSYGAACGQLNFPHGVDITASGDILVCEFMNKRFQQISAEGKPLKCVGTKHDGGIQVCELVKKRNQQFNEGKRVKCCGSRRRRASLPFSGPKDIAVHPHSHNIYITDYNGHRIDILTSEYAYIESFGTKGTDDGQFDNPYGIAFDSTANVFVADHCNHRVQVFTDSGVYVRQFGSGGNGKGELNGPCGLAIDAYDIVYVSERYNHRISLFTRDGQFLRSFGMQGNGPGQFNFPCGIALDEEEAAYVCDLNNGRVQVF